MSEPVSSCENCEAPCGGNPRRVVIDRTNAHRAQHGLIGGFYIRPMSLPPGGVHEGHAHWVDHVSNILQGPLRIEFHNPKTGERGEDEIHEPCKVLILAGVWHRFIAIGDREARWECWFAEAHNAGDKPVTFHQERPDG